MWDVEDGTSDMGRRKFHALPVHKWGVLCAASRHGWDGMGRDLGMETDYTCTERKAKCHKGQGWWGRGYPNAPVYSFIWGNRRVEVGWLVLVAIRIKGGLFTVVRSISNIRGHARYMATGNRFESGDTGNGRWGRVPGFVQQARQARRP